jgi:hypothetical protein
MIGSGIPLSQSSAPFPKDMLFSIIYRFKSNALGFHRFHWRLPITRQA